MHAHCPYRPQLNVVPASTAFSNVQRFCSHCLSDESDRLSFPIQILYLGCPHSPNRKPKNPIGFYLDEEVKKKLVYETGYCALHETMISPISTWCTFDETKSNKGGGLAINNQQKTDITAIRRRGTPAPRDTNNPVSNTDGFSLSLMQRPSCRLQYSQWLVAGPQGSMENLVS